MSGRGQLTVGAGAEPEPLVGGAVVSEPEPEVGAPVPVVGAPVAVKQALV